MTDYSVHFLLILFFNLVFYDSVFSQEKKILQKNKSKSIIGTSITYIWDSQEDSIYKINNLYREWTWSLNIALPVEKFNFGVNSYILFTNGDRSGKNNYILGGIFVQYNLTPKSKNRLYPELNFHRGNYCTCNPLDPYKKDGLYYFGFGGGYNIMLSEHFNLDLAFLSHQILNKIIGKYAYTLYIIGAEYHW